MKWYKLLFLLAFAPLLLFTNSDCGKCRDCPVYTDTLFHDQEFLDYWYFPKGSWWVYQRTDTNAQVFDTATVTNATEKIFCGYDFTTICSQNLLIHIEHSALHYKVTENKPVMLLTAGIFRNMMTSEGLYTNYFSYSNFFGTPLRLITGGAIKLIDSLSTINTPYGELDSVVNIQIRSDQLVWLKKGIGFVKFIHKDSTIWELTDYFISK